MPIYEYHCEGCAADFELLVQSSTKVACPHCQGEHLVKKWSSFAAPAEGASRGQGGGGHAHGSGCGCCAGAGQMGSCGLN